MDIRAFSSYSPNSNQSFEPDAFSPNAGAGGASSSSLQEPRRGTEGAGGAPSSPPGEYEPLSSDCTIEVAVAAAACAEAIKKPSVPKAIICAAELDTAVACLVKKYSDK